MSKIGTKKIIAASFVMLGSIVGAGILGIPYVVAQTGWWIGFFYLIFIGFLALLTNLVVGEIASATKGFVHFPGYVDKYLGKRGRYIMLGAFVISIYGALLAYTIAVGEIVFSITNLFSPVIWSLAFFAAFGTAVWMGIKFLEKYNTVLVYILLFFVFGIAIWAFTGFETSNLGTVNWDKFFLPYGVLLFAYGGAFVLPIVEQMLSENEKAFRKTIILASLLPIVIYILFTLAVVGTTGVNTTEVATIALGEKLGSSMLFFGNLFALLAMGTSFLALGVTLKNMWEWDIKLSPNKATVVTLIVPLTLFLLGWRGFISVLSLFGAFGSGIIMILSTLIFWKVQKYGGEVKVKNPLKYGKLIGIILITVSVLGFISIIYGLIM